MAVLARSKAKEWDDQGLPSLASPQAKAAAEFEAHAYGEEKCSCGTETVCWTPNKRKGRSHLDPL